MKARLLPLGSKYYATKIEVDDYEAIIEIQLGIKSHEIAPSERELDGITIEDFFSSDPGTHYERESIYKISQKIIKALNSENEE